MWLRMAAKYVLKENTPKIGVEKDSEHMDCFVCVSRNPYLRVHTSQIPSKLGNILLN